MDSNGCLSNTATCSFDVTVTMPRTQRSAVSGTRPRNTNPGVCTYTAVGTEFDPTAFARQLPGINDHNNYNSTNTLAGAIFPKGTTTVIWTVTDAQQYSHLQFYCNCN